MRIEVRASGGVTGVRRPPLAIDTAQLPAAEAAELEGLAAGLDLAAEPQRPSGPDRMTYEVTITDEQGQRTGVVGEQALTPEARELLTRVRRLARRGG